MPRDSNLQFFGQLQRHSLALAILILGTCAPLGLARAASDEVQVPASGGFSMVSVEVSRGWESHSSPLVRIADEGPLIRVIGTQSLASGYSRAGLSGMKTFQLHDATSMQISAAVDERRFDHARELDFGMQSADAWLRWPAFGGNLGIGLGLQRLTLSGSFFRRRHALQADWTLPYPDGGFFGFALDHGPNRHAADYADLDSNSTLLLARRQYARPLDWLDDVSIEAGIQSESNQSASPDLSSTAYYARVTAAWKALGLNWTIGGMYQDAKFKASLLPGLAARHDKFRALDFACELPISARTSLKLEVSNGRNDANLPLFESRYSAVALTLVFGF